MTKVSLKSEPHKPEFGSLRKGDFFTHGGRVYVKTNPSLVRDEFFPDRFIKFNVVRVYDPSHPHKVGSRGTFEATTDVIRIDYLKIIVGRCE